MMLLGADVRPRLHVGSGSHVGGRRLTRQEVSRLVAQGSREVRAARRCALGAPDV